MEYSAAIDWLFSTQSIGIKLGLEPMRCLLKEHLCYPKYGVKVIHVAGTNGKGSTCAMIDSIARACGQRSGLFTSPHLINYRERIQVSGKMIPEAFCADELTELRRLAETMEHHPTFFELTLALAMRWFRETECELIVLETGMGGRLDATTAVPADVAVITPIGMDHMQWLGDTLAAIAREKAGIFVEGKPAITGRQEPEAMRVLECEANQVRACFQKISEPLLGYPINLTGKHQRWNAALAVAALHSAGIELRADSVRHGLVNVSWPGRFEEIVPNILLDGAHNPAAADVLAETWRDAFGEEKAVLIFSAVASKDIRGILERLLPIAAEVHFCPVDTPRAVPLEALCDAMPETDVPVFLHENFLSALAAAQQREARILIAGSLFLVGEARAHFTQDDFQSSSQ